MFDLRRPCKTCPFRVGVEPFLSPERVASIFVGPAFQCHNTVDYSGDGTAPGDHPQQCAGLMKTLHLAGHPNQIMQVAERLSGYDPGKIEGEVCVDLRKIIEDHGGDPDKLLPSWMR